MDIKEIARWRIYPELVIRDSCASASKFFFIAGQRQANVRITEPGAVATAFMVRYSFGLLKAVATAPGSVITKHETLRACREHLNNPPTAVGGIALKQRDRGLSPTNIFKMAV